MHAAPRPSSSAQHGRLAAGIGLACLILLGLFAQTAHEATQSHAVCPEHGELIHVEVPASQCGPAHADDFAVACADDVGAGPRLLAHESESGHEHCGLVSLLRPASSPWTSAPARFVPCVESACVSCVLVHAPAAGIPTLAFAPKHSPPARAA